MCEFCGLDGDACGVCGRVRPAGGWRVCDAQLRTISEWASLAAAKASARLRSQEYPGQVYFVTDCSGMVWARF